MSFLYDPLATLVLNTFYIKTHPLPVALWKLICYSYQEVQLLTLDITTYPFDLIFGLSSA